MKALIFAALLTITGRAHASEDHLLASSGPRKTALLELYSSEGCSSCPPADRWVGGLQKDPSLWKEYVPIVLHVTYWNRLGWTDSFAQESMTNRQMEVTNLWQRSSVYTPAVILNGAEWSSWRDHPFPVPDSQANDWQIKLYQHAGLDFSAEVIAPKGSTKSYTLHYALLGFGIQSKVSSGENRGETLEHDFLVLDWGSTILQGTKVPFHFRKSQSWPKRLGVAVWVEENSKPIPLEALGSYL